MTKFAYRIGDETFEVKVTPRYARITHPRWSTLGVGKDLGEAEMYLRLEAMEVAKIYAKDSPASHDEEVGWMVAFGLRWGLEPPQRFVCRCWACEPRRFGRATGGPPSER